MPVCLWYPRLALAPQIGPGTPDLPWHLQTGPGPGTPDCEEILEILEPDKSEPLHKFKVDYGKTRNITTCCRLLSMIGVICMICHEIMLNGFCMWHERWRDSEAVLPESG